MTEWMNTYMFGIAIFGYLAIIVAATYCMQKCRAMIKHAFPDTSKRNDIENAIYRCLAACWLLTSFFGAPVFFLSLLCMLLLMTAVSFVFN